MFEYLEEERQQKNKIKRWMVKWAMQVGQQFKSEKQLGLIYGIKLIIARLLVLNAWKRALSSRIKFMIVGAAALRPEIARLFSAAGVITLSGYGMTEASPYIATNRPDLKKFGSVGLPVPGVEIKLDDVNEIGEGEILVRGLNIMKGYFKRPELNQEVFTTDGWFKTGDLGKFIDKRYLSITGRKKDIFKTSSGIYIVPQELEQQLLASEFISQAFVFGFNKPSVGAVLVPHFNLLKNWCEDQGIHWTSPTYMVHNIKVIQKFQSEIDTLNGSLSNYKKIQKFILSETEWTSLSGELTASLKMIRGKLAEKYKLEIEKLYSEKNL
jgi:long-chain acyl-CoA synthetase